MKIKPILFFSKKIFLSDEKSAIGIGAMIVFIAMVLVASIAASVLIQTSTQLETQTANTGEQTTSEVATGIAIFDVEGHVNVTSQRIDKFAIVIRPRAGSNNIDLSMSLLEISDSNNKYILTYDSNNYEYTPAIGGIFSTDAFTSLTADDFGIIELKDTDNSSTVSNPVINHGDKLIITVNTSTTFGTGGISSNINIWGRMIPENGASGIIKFRTPASLSEEIYVLQ